MDDNQTDAKLMAFTMFVVANARLSTKLASVVEAGGGMAADVYDVLVTLEYAPGHKLRLNELADKIVLSRSGLTRRLDRMENDGYIERHKCSTDRRGAYAVLTDKGREAREAAWPRYREAIRAHFGDRMTEGEARQLGAVMKRVLESLDKCPG